MPFLTGEKYSLKKSKNITSQHINLKSNTWTSLSNHFYDVQRYWSYWLSLKIAHFRLEGETLGRMLDYLSR